MSISFHFLKEKCQKATSLSVRKVSPKVTTTTSCKSLISHFYSKLFPFVKRLHYTSSQTKKNTPYCHSERKFLQSKNGSRRILDLTEDEVFVVGQMSISFHFLKENVRRRPIFPSGKCHQRWQPLHHEISSLLRANHQ